MDDKKIICESGKPNDIDRFTFYDDGSYCNSKHIDRSDMKTAFWKLQDSMLYYCCSYDSEEDIQHKWSKWPIEVYRTEIIAEINSYVSNLLLENDEKRDV